MLKIYMRDCTKIMMCYNFINPILNVLTGGATYSLSDVAGKERRGIGRTDHEDLSLLSE
jgi:hypothetical protein